MKITLQTLMTLVFLSCSSAKSVSTHITKNSNKLDIEHYLESFEKAVLTHDSDKLLNLLDKNYVKEQHDILLRGKTEQFIRELFGGYVVEEPNAFETMDLTSIIKMERKSIIKEEEHLYRVDYLVTNNAYTISVYFQINLYETTEGRTFGLFGAVG